MIEGSCCCGAVRFSIAEKPEVAGACYCSRCRKVGATPFAIVKAEMLTVDQGREHIAVYQPEPSFTFPRSFCEKCGASLGEITSEEPAFPIPMNCFDEDLGVAIRFHEHVARKPSWCLIADDAPQFPGDPS